MGLVLVKPQRVEHTDGWAVANADRETVRYQDGDLEALVGIDRGMPSSRLYVDTLRWVTADGQTTPVREPDRTVVLDRVVAGLQVLSRSSVERYSQSG